MTHSRRWWLGLLVVGLVGVAILTLFKVFGTVFFAITLAYVLYPLRQELVDHGIPARIASALLTVFFLSSILLLMAPPVYMIYQRRGVILSFLQRIPETVPVGTEEFVYVIHTEAVVAGTRRSLASLGIRLARESPVIAVKIALAVFLMYALLYRPSAIRNVSYKVVPAPYHDIVDALHHRTRATLFGIYVVQVATAIVTFLIALPIFYLLGYEAFFSLSVVSGILQFFPVVGPSIVIVLLGGVDVAIGNVNRAILLIPLGLVAIGFLPDFLIRPRLANRTAGMAASLYFVGFTGGALSLGPVGIIAGPLIIALVMEGLRLLSADLYTDAAEPA